MVRGRNIYAVLRGQLFSNGKISIFNRFFHSVYLVFFNTFIFYCWFVCRALAVGRIVIRINAVLWHIRQRTFRSLGLFTWFVYLRTYCVPIATLNQNKWSRLLYLGDAQKTIWIVLVLTIYSHMDCLIDGTANSIVGFTAICSSIASVVADHIRVPSKQQITVTPIIKHSRPGDSWHWVTICRTT